MLGWWMSTPTCRDEGTVLLLMVALVVVIVLSIGVVADVGVVLSARRALAATADSAALAGAQSIELGAYYAGSGGSDLPLDPTRAEESVRRYVHTAEPCPDLRIRQLEISANAVYVGLTCRARLPFVALIAQDSVEVRAGSQARLQRQP